LTNKYYISFDAVNYLEFFPSNSPKLNLTQESDEKFFRWKVDKFVIGKTLNISVYNSLYIRYFDPTYFSLDIKYKIAVNGVDKWFFIDPITSGSINTQNSVFEATPDTDDAYRPLLQKYDMKIWPVGLFGYTLYTPKINVSTFTNVDFTTFSDTGTVTYTNHSALGEKHANLDMDIVPVTSMVTIVVITALSYTNNAPTMRLVDGADATKSNTISITANGVYYLTQTGNGANILVRLAQIDLAGTSGGTFKYKLYYPNANVVNGDRLNNIISGFINNPLYLNLTYTVKSTILWNDALGSDPPASIDTYISAHPTNDYVLQSAAIWNGIWLTRTDTFTTAKENKLEFSLKDLMFILRKIRMWWFIDEDGYFRIEHEKYFRSYDPQVDLTSVTYSKDKPETDVKIYSYDRASSYQQINYLESNQKNEDWIAYPVNFPILETSKIVKYAMFSASFTDLSTDFEYVRDNPGEASPSGLMLLRTVGASGFEMVAIDQSTITTTNYYANAMLGWAWLCKNYYGYFSEAKTGTINNGTAITYDHVKEYLKQSNIRFHSITDIDWKKSFTLSNGIAWLGDASYDEENGMISINVQYDPYA
jgi:hypothetical protein